VTRFSNVMERDRTILEQRAEGKTLQEIADFHSLSVARISQIISANDTAVSPETSRVEQRTQIQWIIDHKLIPIALGPGKLMYANGNGQLIRDENGHPVYDQTICLEAADRVFRGYDRISKLYAVDLPKVKEQDQSPQIAEANAWMRELWERTQQLDAEKRVLEARLARYEASIPEAEIVTTPTAGAFSAAAEDPGTGSRGISAVGALPGM
jgi:hypothetical protein